MEKTAAVLVSALSVTSAVILHKEIATRGKMAVNFPVTSITEAPSLAGDMIFAWDDTLRPLLLSFLGQTSKLHWLEL